MINEISSPSWGTSPEVSACNRDQLTFLREEEQLLIGKTEISSLIEGQVQKFLIVTEISSPSWRRSSSYWLVKQRSAHLVEGQVQQLQVGQGVHFYREMGESVGTELKLPAMKVNRINFSWINRRRKTARKFIGWKGIRHLSSSLLKK